MQNQGNVIGCMPSQEDKGRGDAVCGSRGKGDGKKSGGNMMHLGPRGHDITCQRAQCNVPGKKSEGDETDETDETDEIKGRGGAAKRMKGGCNRMCAGPRRHRGMYIGPRECNGTCMHHWIY